jgi:hypothetical protein
MCSHLVRDSHDSECKKFVIVEILRISFLFFTLMSHFIHPMVCMMDAISSC